PGHEPRDLNTAFPSEPDRTADAECSELHRSHRRTAHMPDVDVVIIGAGVTGLASARASAEKGLSVCVLERHPRAGQGTSTHNTGVIHGGLYYPAGTLKARLCVEGRHLLYDFTARYRIPHARCGKLIVAHDDSELNDLESLFAKGLANGVEGLAIVDRAFMT